MDENKNISKEAVFLAIVVIALGLLIAYDAGHNPFRKKDEPKVAATIATTTESGGDLNTLIREGKITVEQVPLKTNIPAPSLERPLSFGENLDPAVRGEIMARIKATIAELKKNLTSFSDWINLGIERKQLGDYEGAAEAWEYVSLIQPKNAVSFSNLGDLYTNFLKDYPKAEKNMLTVVELNPNSIAGYRNLYGLYGLYYKDKAGETPKILEVGLKNNPENYDLLVLSGQYYKGIGDITKAKSYYERALLVAEKAGQTTAKQLIEAEIQNLNQ
ncbi:MAG: hypothetical protein AAB428_01290 [Patescibacteria group bacterium]